MHIHSKYIVVIIVVEFFAIQFGGIAQNSLIEQGNKYYYGIDCPKDFDKAKAYYMEVVIKKDSLDTLLYRNAREYYKETLTKYSHHNAVLKANINFFNALNNSPAAALNMLGIMARCGEGFEKNDTLAFHYFEKAAKYRDYFPAMSNLGRMYFYGIGCEQNFHLASVYYKFPLQVGMKSASFYTGYMACKGIAFFPQSYEKAIRFFKQGLLKEDANSSYMLGYCFLHGYGVTQNFDTARIYFERGDTLQTIKKKQVNWDSVIDSVKKQPKIDVNVLLDVQKRRLDMDGSMPKFSEDNNNVFLTGLWSGKLYIYDWSRKMLEKVTDVSLILNQSDDSLNGKWYVDNRLVLSFHAIFHKEWFSKRTLSKNRWIVDSQVNADTIFNQVVMTEILFDSDSSCLRGSIFLQDKMTNVPLHPTYFIVDKMNSPKTIISKERSSYNPFECFPELLNTQSNDEWEYKGFFRQPVEEDLKGSP